MSSAEEDYNDSDTLKAKKRKVQRACDTCRRKKIRCDGGSMPDNRCSNCTSYNLECTYVEAAKKRGPPKGYVESLERRLENMEKLLHKLRPDGNFDEADDNPVPLHLATGGGGGPPSLLATATSVIRQAGNPIVIADEWFPSDDDFGHVVITDNFKELKIDFAQNRFFGKSSGIMLVQKAMDLKKEYTGVDSPNGPVFTSKRPEFWDASPWERTALAEQQDQELTYTWPDDDLISSLIDLFFESVNRFFPLLHRPTFEKAVLEGLHLVNNMFGATVMLVCAVASRYSDDPRVFLEGVNSPHSSGWKWFNQVQMVRKSLLAPPSLYDLQFYSLSVLFLQGSSAPQACWTMIGIGVRLAQDVGAHRRKLYNHKLTIEDELWKRAFWVLVCIDRLTSSSLGRPCAIQDEDFDLELPIECDDEYWENADPDYAFKQPPGKPSLMAYFGCYLKLNQILAFALRTIYSINKSKILLGFVGQQWEQHIVAELDSALNRWIDSVPDHLRWDPNREHKAFFDQSALLYACYYQLQILIHRPFIPSPGKPAPLSFPSLAICTNAARSCSHVIDIHRKRSVLPLPHVQMPAFTAGIVLLLNIWGGKRSRISTDAAKEMDDVHKCMQVLKACEGRWHPAGRLWDILYELASVGELPLPQQSPVASNKRDRDSDSPLTSSPSTSTPTRSGSAEAQRTTAGTRRVSSKDEARFSPINPGGPTNYPLPVYSEELGRLPLHDQGAFPSAPLDSTSNYWFRGDPTAQSSNPTHVPSAGSGAAPSTYLVDDLFFEQMTANFSRSFPQPPASGPQYLAGHPGQVMEGMDLRLDHHRQLGASSSQSEQTLLDSDTMTMWSRAPNGFELEDWGTYITNVSGLSQSMNHAGQPHL